MSCFSDKYEGEAHIHIPEVFMLYSLKSDRKSVKSNHTTLVISCLILSLDRARQYETLRIRETHCETGAKSNINAREPTRRWSTNFSICCLHLCNNYYPVCGKLFANKSITSQSKIIIDEKLSRYIEMENKMENEVLWYQTIPQKERKNTVKYWLWKWFLSRGIPRVVKILHVKSLVKIVRSTRARAQRWKILFYVIHSKCQHRLMDLLAASGQRFEWKFRSFSLIYIS